jgi:hypothetical protein
MTFEATIKFLAFKMVSLIHSVLLTSLGRVSEVVLIVLTSVTDQK